MDDMLDTMYDAPGIGLAAVQIGVPERIVVIDLAKEDEEKQPLFLVNPRDRRGERRAVRLRGRLPLDPRIFRDGQPARRRSKSAYLDRQGEAQEMTPPGVLATCVQHEIDHLNGVLFIDYISKLKRDRVVKKFAKAQKLARAGA